MNPAVERERLRLHGEVRAAVLRLYGQCPEFTVNRPKDRRNGDFSASAALALGGLLRRPPIITAREIVSELQLYGGERAEAAGNGFINFFLKPDFLYAQLQPWSELPWVELPNMNDSEFPVRYSYCRLRAVLLLHGAKDGADFSLLTSDQEKRLLWAVALENLDELSQAAMEFYDICKIDSDYLPLKAARCLLLNNALRVMELLLR